MVPWNKSVLPLRAQRAALLAFDGEADIRCGGNKLTWTGTLVPSPVSLAYKVRIVYELGERPKIYVDDPELVLAHDHKLPHVYSITEKNLCLYYPNRQGWSPAKLIANTIVLWASEWLYHYEIWVVTGVWNGGGTNH